MNKEQIKALVASKIAGQGTQVDLGGALPTILDAIVDAIPEGGGGNEPYIVQGASVSADFSTSLLVVPAQEFARAKEAFLAGRVVLIPEIDGIAYMVTAYSRAAVSDSETLEGLCLNAMSESDPVYPALISE